MAAKKQFLTKSRFKVGCECPTKLNYLDDSDFGNNNVDNSFLSALAEGGFQVGELAKLYFPNGVEISTTDKNDAFQQTMDLLKKDEVVFYEGSFLYKNLFVKADIVTKKGNEIRLIEVKAKSIDPTEENVFYSKRSLKTKNPKLNSEWEPYLLDISFQTHVVKKCLPKFTVTSFLLLADKTSKATVDGLNQLFFLAKDEKGRSNVVLSGDVNSKDLGEKILREFNVNKEVDLVWNTPFDDGKSFLEKVEQLSKICESHHFVNPSIGNHCKSCEFRIDQKKLDEGKKSGFNNCWMFSEKLTEEDLRKPLVFDIWNFRKSASLINDNKLFISDVSEEDISPTSSKEVGLSSSERQWLQVKKIQNNDFTPFLDIEGLKSEMKKWVFPLHFIDFETTMVAIPFNKGRKPYEQIAFQFSHHTVSKDGKIAHTSEFINRKKGSFPNFDFVRELKNSLERDGGTVFRFAAHENTVLCQIKNQLKESNLKDKFELIQFIESITVLEDEDSGWVGDRNMVDMCDLVKKYFYHPLTNGSNSIKKVLPAVLNESEFLQNKYSKPIYGSKEIPSHNYKDWTWITKAKNGKVADPYKMLPPIFSDLDLEEMDSLVTEGSIADGGAAMTAYSRMQFTEMSEAECEKVAKALLKYCELDTFAMVMIFEYWNHAVNVAAKKAA